MELPEESRFGKDENSWSRYVLHQLCESSLSILSLQVYIDFLFNLPPESLTGELIFCTSFDKLIF